MTATSTIPRLLIAGTQSGVGKTSLTLGLVALLRRRGLRVQTFKVGPDYLDPTYLAQASGRPCYNLDGWMTGREHVEQLLQRKAADADIAIIEGVMGLFDGAEPDSAAGSSAEIARWLSAPVLLVVNAHGMARSLAAAVHGFATFDPQLRLAGVIANNCGSDRHGRWLAESLKAASLPPLLGAVGRNALPELPSRHLGLVTATPDNLSPALLDQLADALQNSLSIDAILEAARQAPALAGPDSAPTPAVTKRLKLGIARDEAFHFYYPDNLEALEAAGCDLVPFSPIRDAVLPKGLSGLYIGGGYPEEQAAALAANHGLQQSIRAFAAAGGLIYAECGGLMYLSQGIETTDGTKHALLGLLPAWTRMCKRRQSLGYVEVTLTRDSLWGRSGDRIRGHEFHYSELMGSPTESPDWQSVYEARHQRSGSATRTDATREGFQRGNVLASYMHLHVASRPEAIRHFVGRLATQPVVTP